jgi:hypothetical protein
MLYDKTEETVQSRIKFRKLVPDEKPHFESYPPQTMISQYLKIDFYTPFRLINKKY